MIVTISSDPKFCINIQEQIYHLGIPVSKNISDLNEIRHLKNLDKNDFILIDQREILDNVVEIEQFRRDYRKLPIIVVNTDPAAEADRDFTALFSPVALHNLPIVIYHLIKHSKMAPSAAPVVLSGKKKVAEQDQYSKSQQLQAALAQVETGINQYLNLSEVLDQVVKTATEALSLGLGACILLPGDEKHRFILKSSNIQGLTANPDLALTPEHFLAIQWITENHDILVVPDLNSSPYEKSPVVAALGIRSGIGAPLLLQDELVGLLFAFDQRIRQFDELEINFFSALANRASLAITKVQLYQTLVKAKNSAEEAARNRADYLAKMSHELRAPLAAINNLSELMSGTLLTQQQANYLSLIRSSADHLLALVNDILDYSRLEASKMALRPKEFNLIHTVESSLNLIAIPAAQKNLDLFYSIDEDVPETLIGDPNRLGQVLTNLLTNAIKFTGSGVISVEIRLNTSHLSKIAMLNSEVELVFSVKDTGQGITPEEQENLFQPFSQVDRKTPTADPGSGLGLAICKNIVKTMGGEIWVESKGVLGEGSVFSFTFPSKIVHTPVSPYRQKNTPTMSQKSIAVIGNPRFSLHQLMRWLDYWGVEVNYISSIDQFSSLKIQQIDMILLDDRDILAQEIQNLTQQISAWQLRRYLPVLLLTDPNTQVRECFKTIITNVLQWPLNLPKLYRSLTDAIQFSQSITRPLQVKIKSNILLVDDDLINLAAVKLHLERLGYIPDTVSNGFEALKLMTEKKYDLVIMDMRMGALDGHATTRSIRETFASDSQPIIAILTAGVTPNQLNALQNAGIDAYIEKPISVDKLVNLIEMTRLRGQTSSVSTHANIPASINQPVENIQSRVNIKTLSDLYKLSHADNSKNTMDVFQLFFQSAPEVMKQAIHAAHTNNIEKLKDMLHALKGTSEIYGAEFLSSLCKNLENDLEAKGNIDLRPRIEQIEAEYNVVHAMILAFQENPTPLINLTNQ